LPKHGITATARGTAYRPQVYHNDVAEVLRPLFGDVAYGGATLPTGAVWQSLALEGLLTFFLIFVIMAVVTDTRAVGQAAALAIGATVVRRRSSLGRSATRR
jgi:glycerol uptake facilitator-like aquaporin